MARRAEDGREVEVIFTEVQLEMLAGLVELEVEHRRETGVPSWLWDVHVLLEQRLREVL